MSLSAFHDQLLSDGARLEGDHCLFADNASERHNRLVPLSQYGFIKAVGPDGQTFFQGQTTADFRQVGADQARQGGYCSPKGRMLASFTAAQLDDNTLLLQLRRDVVTDTLSVLSKYAVFSKVELSEATAEFVGIGLSGPDASSILRDLIDETPQSALETRAVSGGLVLQCDSAGQGFELWLSPEKALEVWQALKTKAQPTSSVHWDSLRIAAGDVPVCAATRDEFLPQFLNYDLTGAVNFKKGCYTGQEVVARLHFKGVPKRRLYLARIEGEAKAGEAVLDGDKAVGMVALSAEDGRAALVLTTASAESDQLRLEQGNRISELSSPPYGLS